MGFRQRLAVAGLLFVTALVGACTTLPGGARVEGYEGGERALFRGIAYPLPEHQGMPPPKVRYIFHIHGMGLTKRDDFHEDLFSLLDERYDVVQEGTDWTPARLPNPVTVAAEGLDCKPWTDPVDPEAGTIEKPCDFDSFGVFRVDEFRNARGDERVRLYTYFWHRDLWRMQEPHLRKDMARNTGRPPLLNAYLKRETMDGGLSDAATYAGPAGALVRAGISSVLCTMARDAAGQGYEPAAARSLSACGTAPPASPEVEFSYVTHSLGSRMLFDVLAPPDVESAAAATKDDARNFLIDRGRVVFMAANQLPLLALGRVRLSGDPEGRSVAAMAMTADPAESLEGSMLRVLETKRRLEARGGPKASDPPLVDSLRIVAFMDPDDILGFKASDAYRGQVEFVDVTHRNIGQFLWLFTMPQWAHDQEVSNSALPRLLGLKTRQMILCGAKIGANGRVRPYECRPPV